MTHWEGKQLEDLQAMRDAYRFQAYSKAGIQLATKLGDTALLARHHKPSIVKRLKLAIKRLFAR